MFDCTIAWGRRSEAAGNPCKGIVRYRRPPRGRLLGADDLAKSSVALRLREDDNPVCGAAVRLLLLIGCRPGEIRRLRWCEVKTRFTLIDAKTGPRHVLFGEAAWELLDRLAETASGEWVFPATKRDGPSASNELHYFRTTTRDAARIIVADARLHDLSHAHASHAVMNGESLYVAGRLLGHRRASTTNRHVHLDDATLSRRVGCSGDHAKAAWVGTVMIGNGCLERTC